MQIMNSGTSISDSQVSVQYQSPLRTALAGLIGNVLEWFDFAVYGYFASDIGRQFFPQSSASAQQLLAFAVFALGFFARPIGSLALGMVGDRIGRRALLTLSIALMGGSTLLLGLLPTYRADRCRRSALAGHHAIDSGFFCGRRVHGLDGVYHRVGIADDARPRQQFYRSGRHHRFHSRFRFCMARQRADEQRRSNSLGLAHSVCRQCLLCVLGWFLRRGLHETEEGLKAVAVRPPLIPSLIADWLPMVRTFGIVATTNAAYYLTFTYVVERRKSLPGGGSIFLLANTLSLLRGADLETVRRLAVGPDRSPAADDGPDGRHDGLIYPALRLMLFGTPQQFMLGQILLAVPIGMALGLQGAMVVEIFPLRTRVTSMSFAYSITLALAGGTAPLVSAWLIEDSDSLAPAYYVMLHGAIGLALLWPMPEVTR